MHSLAVHKAHLSACSTATMRGVALAQPNRLSTGRAAHEQRHMSSLFVSSSEHAHCGADLTM